MFTPYVYQSYYSAVYISGETKEWCLQFDDDDLITNVDISGHDAWCMMGAAYFTQSFSRQFAKILTMEYQSEDVKKGFWETVYLKHIKELPLFIKKYPNDTILEFDELADLQKFDSSYVNNIGGD